mmetsp:Transcript_6193/g.28413  ORF Transcript_6193/g.28413 Transcript_6193/m.28413 type:complete len:250 (-) Transcript_6193:471-1220(-)
MYDNLVARSSLPARQHLVRDLAKVEGVPDAQRRRPQQRRPETRPRRPVHVVDRRIPHVHAIGFVPNLSQPLQRRLEDPRVRFIAHLLRGNDDGVDQGLVEPAVAQQLGQARVPVGDDRDFHAPRSKRLKRLLRPRRDAPRGGVLVVRVQVIQHRVQRRVVIGESPHRGGDERAPEPSPVADVPHAALLRRGRRREPGSNRRLDAVPRDSPHPVFAREAEVGLRHRFHGREQAPADVDGEHSPAPAGRGW